MTEKPETIFGRSQGITFIAVTLNQEFSSTCRRKNHSEYNCDTFTWSGEHTRTWMCCKKAEQMIIRTLWSAFTQFTIMNEKKNSCLLFVVQEEASRRRRLTNIQATAWPGHLWTENLVCFVKSSSAKGRKAATGYRETEVRQLMSPRDSVWKGLYQKITKITLLRGVQLIESLQSCAQSSFLCSKPMRIPDTKAAVVEEWEKLEKLPTRQMTKVKSKMEVIQEAQRDQKKVWEHK